MANAESIVNDLYTTELSREELAHIRAIVEGRINVKNRIQLRSFKVGDKVTFNTKNRGTYCGEVIKVNRVNVKVRTNEGQVWTVAPSLLYRQ